jgi:lipopolysaccharide transport protein LptA
MEARITDADATLQPGDPSNGPVTLTHADLTLYREGKPSLWLKAPVASWKAGLLTAPHGADSGSVDGKITLHGKKHATWTAKSDLLAVTTATCEVREPGRPTLLAAGPTATWQNGLLTLPSGGTAHATDGSSSMRADQVRWRAKTRGLEATGRVRMTQGRLAGAAGRLTGDTTLRQFHLTGGRPKVTFYNQAAPLVTAAVDIPRRRPVPNPRSWLRMALVGAPVVLAAVHVSAAPAMRQKVTLNTGETVEADDISGVVGVVVHARGRVMVTGAPSAQRTLGADQIDVTQSKSPAGSSHSAVQEARATGHVRMTSQPKPGERMEATGAAGTYWPGTQKATLTGGVTVTMTSPQLQEPAVLTGAKADIDLAQRAADVTRTEAAQVSLKLRPKADSSSSGSPAAGPVRLDADRIRMENAANRVTATGSPMLTGDQGTVRAEKIWFDIDPKANDIKMVHAADSVRIDSQDAQGGAFHGMADEAVMNRADNTVVLTGNVKGTHSRPDVPEPDRFSTSVLTYNQKTGEYRMGSSDETRSRVTFKPRPKPAGPADSGAGAVPAAPARGKSSRGRRGK